MLCLPKSSAFCGWWQSAGQLATAEKQGQNRPRQGSRAGVCEWRAVGLAGAVRCPSVSVTPVSRRKGKQSHHPQCHQQAKQPHRRGAAWQAQQANSKSAEDERVAIPLWSGSVITHAHTRSHHSKSDHKVSGYKKGGKDGRGQADDFEGQDSRRSARGVSGGVRTGVPRSASSLSPMMYSLTTDSSPRAASTPLMQSTHAAASSSLEAWNISTSSGVSTDLPTTPFQKFSLTHVQP